MLHNQQFLCAVSFATHLQMLSWKLDHLLPSREEDETELKPQSFLGQTSSGEKSAEFSAGMLEEQMVFCSMKVVMSHQKTCLMAAMRKIYLVQMGWTEIQGILLFYGMYLQYVNINIYIYTYMSHVHKWTIGIKYKYVYIYIIFTWANV